MPYKNKKTKNAYQNKWYRKNREYYSSLKRVGRQKRRDWIQKYKADHPCVNCGESDWRCLDFHHSTGKKEHCIANMVGPRYSFKKIEEEVHKCIVLCANCHRKEHANQVRG